MQAFSDYQKLRETLIDPKTKEKDQKRATFVITYNKTLPNVNHITKH